MVQKHRKTIEHTSPGTLGALTHCLLHQSICKIQNGLHGAQKWPTGSGKGYSLSFFGASINFCKQVFWFKLSLSVGNIDILSQPICCISLIFPSFEFGNFQTILYLFHTRRNIIFRSWCDLHTSLFLCVWVFVVDKNWETSSDVVRPSHPLSHPPTRESIFEPLLDYLWSWNLVWRL